MAIARFEDLVVWQGARGLAIAVYRATDAGAFSRDYALRDQIRRASISVMSNIAEGFERYSHSEFRHFISIARGSVSEVRSQLHLAHAVAYIDEITFDTLHALCLEISRLLAALHHSLGTKQPALSHSRTFALSHFRTFALPHRAVTPPAASAPHRAASPSVPC